MTSVTLDEVCGRELRYLLPFSGARASVLTQLFRELEGAKEHLGVVSYGLTACSMEEVGGLCGHRSAYNINCISHSSACIVRFCTELCFLIRMLHAVPYVFFFHSLFHSKLNRGRLGQTKNGCNKKVVAANTG